MWFRAISLMIRPVQDQAGYECYDIAVANILAPVIIMLQGEICSTLKARRYFHYLRHYQYQGGRTCKEAMEANPELEIHGDYLPGRVGIHHCPQKIRSRSVYHFFVDTGSDRGRICRDHRAGCESYPQCPADEGRRADRSIGDGISRNYICELETMEPEVVRARILS